MTGDKYSNSAIFQTQKKETKKLSMIHVFDDVHKF